MIKYGFAAIVVTVLVVSTRVIPEYFRAQSDAPAIGTGSAGAQGREANASDSCRYTYDRLSAEDRKKIETSLTDLARAVEAYVKRADTRGFWWPTHIGKLVRLRLIERRSVHWPILYDTNAYSLVIRPRSRTVKASSVTPGMKNWLQIYLRPEVLGHTRTCVLFAGGRIEWVSTDELARLIRDREEQRAQLKSLHDPDW